MGHLQTLERPLAAATASGREPAAVVNKTVEQATALLEKTGRVDGNLEGFENPFSDLFTVEKFHHVEFWCGDASNTWRRFSWGLGMNLVAKSDQTTGNQTYCSYVVQSNDLMFAFTAPYSQQMDQSGTKIPHPGVNADEALSFFQKHGLGVRAVGLLVDDAQKAYEAAIENGGVGVLEPVILGRDDPQTSGTMKMAEVKLCGDVVLRLVSNHGFNGPYLPGFEAVSSPPLSYGIQRLDHAASNVPSLADAMTYLRRFTGFHEFAEYTTAENLELVKVESGLNSLVVSNNSKMVLLSMNEPVFGTKRKSQIQTYLEHNEGPGLQHLALICSDIFSTLREMRMRTHLGGFDFMPKPPPTYYEHLPTRIGSILTERQFQECEELGILADKDEEGVLLQIFTKPVGDRPTIFIEIIQRIGCMVPTAENQIVQRAACGGFGKGNFSALFKSVEEYEKTLYDYETKSASLQIQNLPK